MTATDRQLGERLVVRTVAARRSDERSHITVARVGAILRYAQAAVVAREIIAHFNWTYNRPQPARRPTNAFGRPLVKRFALYAICYRTIVLSCPVLSVCNVGALWPIGWMDQDATWYGSRSRPRPHSVRLGPELPPRKKTQ